MKTFFDRINHQRLMAPLAERLSDKRVLEVIGKMLKAQAMMRDRTSLVAIADHLLPRLFA